MRFSVVALAGLTAAAPSTLVARQSAKVDISGSYWDVTLKTESGRPGYSIRDLAAVFNNPKFEQSASGKCHYSFVPQGTSPPAETDTCDKGLTYTWDYKVLTLSQKVVVGNETLTMYGSGELKNDCKSSGMGSTCTATGRVELSHYCRLDPLVGCYAPDGST